MLLRKRELNLQKETLLVRRAAVMIKSYKVGGKRSVKIVQTTHSVFLKFETSM